MKKIKILICVMLVFSMLLAVSCSTELGHSDEEDHDHDGDGVQDHSADEHNDEIYDANAKHEDEKLNEKH